MADRCGLVNRPVRSPRARSSVSIMRAVEVLPLVPVMWIDRVGALRLAEQVQSAPGSGPGRSSIAGSRPAGSRRARGSGLGRHAQPRSVVLRVRRCQLRRRLSGAARSWPLSRAMSAWAAASRSRLLATTAAGALATNAALPASARPARPPLGRGQVLLQPGALGRHVDGAARVQFDGHAAGRGQRGGARTPRRARSAGAATGSRPRARPAACRRARSARPGPAGRAAGPGRRGTGGPR